MLAQRHHLSISLPWSSPNPSTRRRGGKAFSALIASVAAPRLRIHAGRQGVSPSGRAAGALTPQGAHRGARARRQSEGDEPWSARRESSDGLRMFLSEVVSAATSRTACTGSLETQMGGKWARNAFVHVLTIPRRRVDNSRNWAYRSTNDRREEVTFGSSWGSSRASRLRRTGGHV